MAEQDKPSICFVALNCYNLLASRGDIKHIGGAEVQQCYMAKWLLERGYPVSFVVLDYGQNDVEQHQGIKIYKAYQKEAGLPVLRFLYPRWHSLLGAMRAADADIYYQRGAGLETGQVSLWCRSKGKKFIFGSASDADCMSSLPLLSSKREITLYKWGLAKADAVVAQTRNQQVLFKQNFGITADLQRSSGVALGEPVPIEAKENAVLWAGRIAEYKRFEWLLDIAQACPQYRFVVVGAANVSNGYARQQLARAREIENVEFHGHIPREQMVEFYNRCKFLISTSLTEGFPNIFIEAWHLGLPVISTFDPDGVIENNRLGTVVDSVDAFVKCLLDYCRDEEGCKWLSDSVREYSHKAHSLDQNMPIFERVLGTCRG